MGYTKYQIFLVALMLLAGTLSTLTAKLADKQTGKYPDGKEYPFSHPFFQAWCMFVGEALCFLFYEIIYRCFRNKTQDKEPEPGKFNVQSLIAGNRDFNPLILLPAACLDTLATSIGYTGLNLTYASSFQMLNGAIMIFTGLLSVAFLNRELQRFKWFGIFVVVIGLSIIGVCDFIYSDGGETFDTNGIIAGDLLILLALSISSFQLVYEEKFVNKHDIPALKAVGWEGIFGFMVLGTLMIPLYYIRTPAFSQDDPENRLENLAGAFHQLKDNPVILVACLVNLFAIGILNFAGISVTKELSATTRVVLSNLRTILVYIITLALKWQAFHALQLLGLFFLILGMCIYNNIIVAPLIEKIRNRNRNVESFAVNIE